MSYDVNIVSVVLTPAALSLRWYDGRFLVPCEAWSVEEERCEVPTKFPCSLHLLVACTCLFRRAGEEAWDLLLACCCRGDLLICTL